MNTFLTSNEIKWRLLRTIVQGVLGVIIANIDVMVGTVVLDPAARALIVALVMAVLSPIMAELGKHSTPDPDEYQTALTCDSVAADDDPHME